MKIKLQFFAKTIDDYKKDYAEAKARGDYEGMQKANDGANAIRRANGEAEQKATTDIANTRNQYSSSSSGTSSSKGTSGGASSNVDLGTMIQNAINSNAGVDTVRDLYNQRYDKIANNSNLQQYYNDNDIMNKALQYINSMTGDKSLNINSGILSGMSSQEAQELYNQRLDKALGIRGYEKYANDDIMQTLQSYIAKAQAKEKSEEEQAKQREKLEELLREISNMEFEYDLENDPSYQAYKDQYQREGERARQNTLADAVSLTGGLGNSWAMTSSQMANDYYNSMLGDKIPELYEIAYNRFDNDRNSKLNQLDRYTNVYDRTYEDYINSQDELNNFIKDYREQNNYEAEQERNNYQWDKEYELEVDKLDFDKEMARIDQEYKEKQAEIQNWLDQQRISISQASELRQQAEFEYRKQQDALDRQASGDGDITAEVDIVTRTALGQPNPEQWLLQEYQAGNITQEQYTQALKLVKSNKITGENEEY